MLTITYVVLREYCAYSTSFTKTAYNRLISRDTNIGNTSLLMVIKDRLVINVN